MLINCVRTLIYRAIAMDDLKDKIWITRHSRIYSEKRYKLYDVTSHIFLSFISLLLIFGSIFSEDIGGYSTYFDKIMIFISLLVFSTSLIVYGFKFEGKSKQYRECYLKLQDLEQNLQNLKFPEQEYISILKDYPNHSDRDYHDFIFSRNFFNDMEITIGKKKIRWTWWMLMGKVVRFIMFWCLLLIPPILIVCFFAQPFLYATNLSVQ